MKKSVIGVSVAALVIALAGCSSDGDTGGKATTPPPAANTQATNARVMANDPSLQGLADAFNGTANLLDQGVTINMAVLTTVSSVSTGICSLSYAESSKKADEVGSMRVGTVVVNADGKSINNLCDDKNMENGLGSNEILFIGKEAYMTTDGDNYKSATMSGSLVKELNDSQQTSTVIENYNKILNGGKIKKTSDNTYTMTIDNIDDFKMLAEISGSASNSSAAALEQMDSIKGTMVFKTDGSTLESLTADLTATVQGQSANIKELVSYDKTSARPTITVPKNVTPSGTATINSMDDLSSLAG